MSVAVVVEHTGVDMSRGIVLAALTIALSCVTATAAVAPIFKLLVLDGRQVRWQASGTGPIVVRFAFAAETVDQPSARNCRTITPLDGLAETSRLDIADVKREIVAGLRRWEQVTPIRFLPADDWRSADLLIGARPGGPGSAFADVMPNTTPSGVAGISRALICFNPAHPWKIGFDGDHTTYDLRYVASHEAGHAIGLDHPSRTGQLMSYRYDERFGDLQAGDAVGAAKLYSGRPRLVPVNAHPGE